MSERSNCSSTSETKQPPMMDKNKVLIVEDNKLNLKLFSDLLQMKKFEVTTSIDGVGVYDQVLDQRPCLILMDIQLNNISGLDIIKELKNSTETKHIPIIAITAFAMKHDEQHILQSGCDLYLSKPVSIDTFYNSVKKFVELN